MISSDRAIENLLYTYAERIDSGDLEGVASLFAHGCIKPGPDAGPEAVARGRDAVLKMYQDATRLYPDGTPRTRHLTTNAIVEVSEAEDRGSARSYFTVLQQTEALPLQPIIAGRYHDTFHRIQGVWWFDTRIMLVDLMGDLKQHLLYALS